MTRRGVLKGLGPFFLAGCGERPATTTDATLRRPKERREEAASERQAVEPVDTAARFTLARARKLLSLSEAELRRQLSPRAQETPDSKYQKMQGLAEIEDPSIFSGSIFVRHGRVELLYASDEALQGCTPEILQRQLTTTPEILASRAAKSSSLIVYAEEGIAYSKNHDELEFVEVFHPRAFEAYQRDIYIPRGPMIR